MSAVEIVLAVIFTAMLVLPMIDHFVWVEWDRIRERRQKKALEAAAVPDGGEPFKPFGETHEDKYRAILQLHAPEAVREARETAVILMRSVLADAPMHGQVKDLTTTVGARACTLAMGWLRTLAISRPYSGALGREKYLQSTVDIQTCTEILFAAEEKISIEKAKDLLEERWFLMTTAPSYGSDALDMYVREIAEDRSHKPNEYTHFGKQIPKKVTEGTERDILEQLSGWQNYYEPTMESVWSGEDEKEIRERRWERLHG